MKEKYDYLIVGSGLMGATFAHLAHQAGKRCLVLERRPWTGGNVHQQLVEGINVHQYGAHIFHTDYKDVSYAVESCFLRRRMNRTILLGWPIHTAALANSYG